ncbi:DUF1190 domain-containing protein [Roseomonas sp. 18066]|uniref:DUF1190 domain-containing protein n=1 Tax=Roseomonas sp. 18066 TaxID=2681412 RepID=UPI0013579F98|nr:DUF1190 domain-containing protein [Roseomonas sp. 18066]
MTRRRSTTIRAAALVGLGLGVAACDEAPPPADTPQDAARREADCTAAHRRLGADPAGCTALERLARQQQEADRPHFETRLRCEMRFGPGACDGESSTLPRAALWRPVLAGGAPGYPQDGDAGPVVTDRRGQSWALRGALPPAMVATPAEPLAPSLRQRRAFDRLAPTYADRAACDAEWQRCEGGVTVIPNRFAEDESCRAIWGQCTEVRIALPATAAVETPTAQGGGGGGGGGGYGGGGGHFWWSSYNQGWERRYASSYAPRYQGWSWTGDRQPVAVYRRPGATGAAAQAWDSGSRSLAPAGRMVAASETTAGSRSGSTVARAGFGSTGRSLSAGG